MRELTLNEVDEVSGGLAPLVVVGLWAGGGVAAGLGVSWAVNTWW